MRHDRFDMVVLGSGPAGEKAAAQAAYHGKRVAVVERSSRPGGAAAANAGIPTKTLREAALYVTGFRQRAAYGGLRIELDPALAIRAVHERTSRVVEAAVAAVRENLRRHHVELVHGTGRLRPGGVDVEPLDGGPGRSIDAPVTLIATGSRPLRPPGIDFDDPDVYDSDEIVSLDRPVGRLAVIGGGVIGCEYASIFRALGSEVVLVNNAPRLVPFLDEDVTDGLAAAFRAEGIDLVLDSGRAAVARDGDGLLVEVGDDARRVDAVLFAAGRVGNTEGLRLADAGVEVDDRGYVVVDEKFRTTAPGVYAAGDVVGPPALASVSMEQGRVAACDAFDIPFKLRVDPIAPFGVYSIPEAAMVGCTEGQARERGEDFEVGVATFDHNSRAIISGATDGLVKLVFRTADKRLLGVHVLGDIAAELIHIGQAALHFDATIDYFLDATFNIPTRSDLLKYAAYDGLQRLAARAARRTT
jgi:NAD(P) transhydrogenase